MPNLKPSTDPNMDTVKSNGSERSGSSGPATMVANGLYTFNNAINGVLERAFESLGRLVGRRPILIIIGMLSCVEFLSIMPSTLGLCRLRREKDVGNLHVYVGMQCMTIIYVLMTFWK